MAMPGTPDQKKARASIKDAILEYLISLNGQWVSSDHLCVVYGRKAPTRVNDLINIDKHLIDGEWRNVEQADHNGQMVRRRIYFYKLVMTKSQADRIGREIFG